MSSKINFYYTFFYTSTYRKNIKYFRKYLHLVKQAHNIFIHQTRVCGRLFFTLVWNLLIDDRWCLLSARLFECLEFSSPFFVLALRVWEVDAKDGLWTILGWQMCSCIIASIVSKHIISMIMKKTRIGKMNSRNIFWI